MGTFMKSKSPNDILNQWWADGVPLSGAGGASGAAVALPARITTIAGVTPMMIDKTQGVAVKTIGGATPTMTSGAQLIYQSALEHTTPALTAVTIEAVSTEYVYGLPTNCRSVEFQCRTEYDVRYAFESGKVASGIDPYKTLKAGDVYYKESLKTTAATLHFAADAAGLRVEVEAWT